jgi:Zn-dependent peptidase ImmA (M78 family)/transcriptional regulator with XRE-family HTH domain
MKEKLPINNIVLVWARTSLGLSQEDVAKRMSKEVDEINGWELGETSPTYSQLERLAHEIYKRPVAVFFFPEVPKEESPKSEFRTLPDTIVAELPPEMIKLYRKAKVFQLYLEELYEREKPVKTSLLDSFELNEKSQFASITKAIRKALGISIEEQSKWKSAETGFKKWRESLEANGVFVFKDGFRNDDYSGFCLYDAKYPILFINNSMPDSRQAFTLFHELGHLLYRSGGIDFRSREAVRSFSGYYLNVEVACNRFANEFLVPQEVFDSFKPDISEAHFQRLADHFSVSREVILRNYLDRGVVDANYYEKMSAKWIEQARKEREAAGSGNYHLTQKAYLGENYIHFVYGKYYQNKFTVDHLAEYLNVKPKNLPKFEHFVMEGGKAR